MASEVNLAFELARFAKLQFLPPSLDLIMVVVSAAYTVFVSAGSSASAWHSSVKPRLKGLRSSQVSPESDERKMSGLNRLETPSLNQPPAHTYSSKRVNG